MFMDKHLMESNRSRKLDLDPNLKKVKRNVKLALARVKKTLAEVAQLQAVLKAIVKVVDNRDGLNAIQEIANGVKFRLQALNRQSLNLKRYKHKINLIIHKSSAAKDEKWSQRSKARVGIEPFYSAVNQIMAMVAHDSLQNRIAMEKINRLQQLATLPQHDLGRIRVLYVDRYNNVIKRQTELGRIGQAFNLAAHLTELPRDYRFIKILTGRHLMLYRSSAQQAIVEVTKDSAASNPLIYQRPKVERDPRQICRIQLIYLTSQGKVVQIHDSLGQKGSPFSLKSAIHLPAHYNFVKVISGLNVKQYCQHEQLIEIEIKADSVRAQPRINADQVRQAFLDYYNAKIMNLTPHSSNYSVRFGYYCAKQYLMGIADAYQDKTLQKRTQLYRRGYQVFCHEFKGRPVKDISFPEVLLKIYQVVMRDVALLNHDLKQGTMDF